jgi:ATP-dependent helicase/nuclease subunit B
VATPTVALVRHGPDAHRLLADAVRAAQGDDALAPVTVVVPSSRAGLSLRRLLAAGDGAGGSRGIANVEFSLLGDLAYRIGGPVLSADQRRPLTDAVLRAAVRAHLRATPARVFGEATEHPALVRAAVVTYRELRELDRAGRRVLAGQGERAAAVVALVEDVEERVAAFFDPVDLHRAAAGAVARDAGDALGGLGALIVHLPVTLTPSGEMFVAACAAHLPVRLHLGLTGDPILDGHLYELAARLAPGVPVGVTGADAVPVESGTAVLSAPSADTEVLAIAREVVERLKAGTPLERMAVAFDYASGYPRLVREVFGAAGIACNGPGSRPLSATVAGRTLLGALTVAEGGWRRDDLMAWVTGSPLRFEGRTVPAAGWDLVSAGAGVVEGLGQWQDRLSNHVSQVQDRIDAAAEVDAPEWRAIRWRHEVELAEGLARFVRDSAARFTDPATDWAGWAGWAHRLLDELLGRPPSHREWPTTEVAALDAVAEALGALGALDSVDADPAAGPPDLGRFRVALTAELEAPAPEVSRFGHGVYVGPVRSLAGLDVDVIWVVGMADGRFPARRSDDALVPDRERKAAGTLPTRAVRADDDRRHYLAALAAAPERRLSFARGDQREGQLLRPSRWLLDTLEILERSDRRLYARDMAELDAAAVAAADRADRPGPGDGAGGYRFVASMAAAVRAPGEPASLADRDLRALLRAREDDGTVRTCPLALYDVGLRDGIDLQRGRRSGKLTRFDGLVRASQVAPPVERVHAVTTLEGFAACPRRFFFGSLLGLSAKSRPEDVVRLAPSDRGIIVHKILERFYAEQLARPAPERPGPGTPWSAEDRARMVAIAAEVCDDAEARGITGRSLLWHHDRAVINRDLSRFLDEDERWREHTGAEPFSVELAFDAVTVTLPDGRDLQLRGRADRVDRTTDGAAIVIDYKTGRPIKQGQLDDAIACGTHLQLPVYARAASQRTGADRVGALYWFLSSDTDPIVSIEAGPGSAIDEAARVALSGVVSGIEAGAFAAHPGDERGADGDADRSFVNCVHCDFASMCSTRRLDEWERKQQDPALGPYRSLLGNGPAT